MVLILQLEEFKSEKLQVNSLSDYETLIKQALKMDISRQIKLNN